MVKVDPNTMVDNAFKFISLQDQQGQILSSKVKPVTGEKGKATFAEKHTKLAKIIEIFGFHLERTDELSVAYGLRDFTKSNRSKLDGESKKTIIKILDNLKIAEKKDLFESIKKQIEDIQVTGKTKSTKPGTHEEIKPTKQDTTTQEATTVDDSQIKKFYGVTPTSQDMVELKKLLPEFTGKLLYDYSTKNDFKPAKKDYLIMNNCLKLAVQAESKDAIKNMIQVIQLIPLGRSQLEQRQILKQGALQAAELDDTLFFKEFENIHSQSYISWSQKNLDYDSPEALWDKVIAGGSVKTLNYLLDKKHFLWDTTKTVLHHSALKASSVEDFKKLAEPILKKAPQLLTENRSQLSLAVFLMMHNKGEILNWLLDNYELPLVDEGDGDSALSMAVEGKNAVLAEKLIRKDPNGITWKAKGCEIEGITSTDTVEDAVAKMKAQIQRK